MSWKELSFEECIEKIKTPSKLQKNKYLSEGKFPVVAQESSLINGYSNDKKLLYKISSPIIIFGDHTRIFKFIDFNFILGADGAKIIKPKSNIDPKFFLYYLKAVTPKSLGYARHYKLLKKIKFKIPPINLQKKIINKLEKIYSRVDELISNSKSKQNKIEEIYSNYLDELYFKNKKIDLVKVKEISEVKGGKRLPKGTKLLNEVTNFPYIRVSDFTESGTINEDSVKYITKETQAKISKYTITDKDVYLSIAGTIGKTGVIPSSLNNSNLTENAVKIVLDKKCLRDFFYFFTKTSSFKSQALKQTRKTAQPKLALKRLSEVELPLFSISDQIKIIDKIKQLNNHKMFFLNINQNLINEYESFKSKITLNELN